MQVMSIVEFDAEGTFLLTAAECYMMLIRTPPSERDNTHLVQRRSDLKIESSDSKYLII